MSRALPWLLAAAALTLLYLNRQKLFSIASRAGEFMLSNLAWRNENEGPRWTPILDSVGAAYQLPANLLARVAYQESRFRDDIIRGRTESSKGAAGILQLMPAFFGTVAAPRPYSDADVTAQIKEAAAHLKGLYLSTHSWPLALAAYNAGLGNVQKHAGIPPFAETQAYVAQIAADLPEIRTA